MQVSSASEIDTVQRASGHTLAYQICVIYNTLLNNTKNCINVHVNDIRNLKKYINIHSVSKTGAIHKICNSGLD